VRHHVNNEAVDAWNILDLKAAKLHITDYLIYGSNAVFPAYGVFVIVIGKLMLTSIK